MSYLELKNGMKIYYEDCGKGPALIMLHGWTSGHHIFSEPVQTLKHHARCIIYDHRGHSGSKYANSEPVTMETLASDLNELICTLSLTDITLLGWSMGASAIMNYVRDYGCSALRQIVLCDMTPKALNGRGWHLGLYKGRYNEEMKKRYENSDFFSEFKAFSIATKPEARKLPGFILNHILKKKLMYCDIDIIKGLSDSMLSQDNRDVIPKISVPVTYFYAQPGSLFSPDLAKWYAGHVKSPFNSVTFPHSTHLLIEENPELFTNEVIKLL